MFSEQLREDSGTYFVQDQDSMEEMRRLEVQDAMLTTGLGGVLPKLVDTTTLRRVLDVGCGTGSWLMETAHAYPMIEKLIGVDSSRKLLDYVRSQQYNQLIDDRIEFRVMNALLSLDFRPAFFDLVNQRLGGSWICTWEWKKLLGEYQRITKAGGIIQITEANIITSNSPTLKTLCDIVMDACYRSGRFFVRDVDGLTRRLASLMTEHGIEDVQTRENILVFRAGTSEHQSFFEDKKHLFRVSLPFFQKWTAVPSNYEEIYQQALKEMQEPSFFATWHLLTTWGIKSKYGHTPN